MSDEEVRRGLWRNNQGEREGKYLVIRRDGTVPEWPNFVIAAADPAAPGALLDYAAHAEALGLDDAYVQDIRDLAVKFHGWRALHYQGDPDAPRHRPDNPRVIRWMQQGQLDPDAL